MDGDRTVAQQKTATSGSAWRRIYAKDGEFINLVSRSHAASDHRRAVFRVLNQFLAGTDQRSQSFGQQAGVKRLLERFIDCRAVEGNWISIIRQQSDKNRFREIVILSQILADLQRFNLPN